MLKMDHVTKTFEKCKALDDFSLHIPKGSIYGMVGPNGAGKTTAISLLTGIYRPDSGTVTMEGQPVFENVTAKGRMGYIPDEIAFYPATTMAEMRRFYRGVYPQFDDALFEKLNEIFSLPKKSQIRRFSRGMQKQAAFQLMLCTRPDVLILDEPIDGLDPVMRRQVWNLLLDDVAQRQTTVLISSHNLRELEDICDHVGIMDHGKMLLQRSLADMQGNTVKLQLVGDVPEDLETLHQSQQGKLKTLVVRGSAQEVAEKVRAASPVYYDVLPLSLEEIFIYELGGVNYEVKNIAL